MKRPSRAPRIFVHDRDLNPDLSCAASIIWHISDRIAIRPEISFATAGSEARGEDANQTNVVPGFSVLFSTARWDDVRAYVSPRYVYSHSTTSARVTEVGTGRHELSGSVGALFTPHRRFGVFGEVGIAWDRSTSDAGLFGEVTVSTWRIRSAVGAILYF